MAFAAFCLESPTPFALASNNVFEAREELTRSDNLPRSVHRASELAVLSESQNQDTVSNPSSHSSGASDQTKSQGIVESAQVVKDASPSFKFVPLSVVLNGTPMGSWVFLERGNELFVTSDVFFVWRVSHQSKLLPIQHAGKLWFALSEIPGYSANIDYSTMTIQIMFAATSFLATDFNDREDDAPLVLSPSQWAAYSNYDVSYTSTRYSSRYSSRDLDAFVELGLTGPAGLLSINGVGRNLTGGGGEASNWTRLETTYVYNSPERQLTWSLGDSVSQQNLSGSSFYFGGLQIRRNFDLTPNFNTMPVPVMSGLSNNQSTLEVYINDVLRQTSNVQAGPFVLQNLPPINGQGDVRVVMRDILGRETIVSQSFFSDSTLLAPGLTDWSADLGAIRENYGSKSNDYGDVFLSGALRQGLSDALTGGASIKWSGVMSSLGVGATFTLPANLVSNVGLAVSRTHDQRQGLHWEVDLIRKSKQHSVALHLARNLPGFRRFPNVDAIPSEFELGGSYGFTPGKGGSLNVSFAGVRTGRDDETLKTMSLGGSLQLGNYGHLTLTASRFLSASNAGSYVAVMWTIPINQGFSTNASVSRQGGITDSHVQMQKFPESGLGWNVLSGRRGNVSYTQAGANYEGRYGRINAESHWATAQDTLRLGAQGGLVYMRGNLFPTRAVHDSFALADVSGLPGLSVQANGGARYVTNAAGYALIPQLSSMSKNSLSLSPTELPLSAELDSIEHSVTPGWRSAVEVKFLVRSGRAALLTLISETGEVLPPGALLQLDGMEQTFYLARRGAVFATGLTGHHKGVVQTDGARCRIEFDLPDLSTTDIAHIGPLTCQGESK